MGREIRVFLLIATLAVVAAGQLRPVGAGQSGPPNGRYVIVCRDAGAGGYEAFPDLCRTRDGELLCVFYAGFGHVSLPSYAPGGNLPPNCPNAGRVCLVRSRDNGRTWSKPIIVADTPRDDRDPSIVQLPDGTLLCNYFSHRPGRGGQGYRFVHSALVRSTDGGRTWSEEQALFDKWACSSPIRILSDGRLALPLYYVGPVHSKGASYGGVTFSTDKGQTWSDPVPIGKDGPLELDAEPDIVELPGGVLLAGLRPTMAFSWSRDGGRNWSAPEPAGFPAHCVYFLRTSKGILLMGHRLPGTSLHYSLDDGKSWSENVQLDRAGGAYPSMVELPNGTIYCVYYEEGPRSDIRGIRFSADRTGIRIIPPAEWKE
ncbi:hypothetical protein AMJ85_01615 [candidate division BRC1 bacterium SM23_51]|nr:MAG: hypothetical protein AMJ85_01615 [candidate division BRC1 bacterium SM23_51]